MKFIKNLFFTLLATHQTLGIAAEASILVADAKSTTSTIDLMKVYEGCPVIYILLLVMSLSAFIIWFYTLLTLRLSDMLPTSFINQVRELLSEKQFEAALVVCKQDNNFSSSIIASGITARKYGPQVIMDAMQAEGRRSGNSLWQRISLLNEISVIAPMLGLLGTVIGLFFAFYDANRSAESIASIFDGLGVAVGTTVAGLIVAIFAMIFYTSLKFRLVSLLNTVENELLSLVSLLDTDPLNL